MGLFEPGVLLDTCVLLYLCYTVTINFPNMPYTVEPTMPLPSVSYST